MKRVIVNKKNPRALLGMLKPLQEELVKVMKKGNEEIVPLRKVRLVDLEKYVINFVNGGALYPSCLSGIWVLSTTHPDGGEHGS